MHVCPGVHAHVNLVASFAFDYRRWKVDCRSNKRAFAKLHNGAEMCKHILSTRETAQVSVDSLCDGIDFQATVARYEGTRLKWRHCDHLETSKWHDLCILQQKWIKSVRLIEDLVARL